MEVAASIFLFIRFVYSVPPYFLITPLYFRKIPISDPNYQSCIL